MRSWRRLPCEPFQYSFLHWSHQKNVSAGPVTRRVSGRRYLFFGCNPDYGIAERAPAHGEAPFDKAEIGKLLHLHEHVASRDKHRMPAAPTGKLVVPGQEDPVFALCKRKEPGVLVGIPVRNPFALIVS